MEKKILEYDFTSVDDAYEFSNMKNRPSLMAMDLQKDLNMQPSVHL